MHFKASFFLILLFYVVPIVAQTPASREKWGTIKVKKIRSDKTLPKLVAKKKPGIRVFRVRYNGIDYKITFPTAYQSGLFPLLFNNQGLILSDENKQWSDNIILGYNYEISIGDAIQTGGSVIIKNVTDALIRNLSLGQFLWIKGLYYSDSKGIIHRNEIGEFKIEHVK
jgi:hypothetical protein